MRGVTLILTILACAGSLPASTVVFRGKVVLDDGTPPGGRVSIERRCVGLQDRIEAVADKSGQYVWHSFIDPLYDVSVSRCLLIAVLKGYHSTTIDLTDSRFGSSPTLPNLVLTRASEGPSLAIAQDSAPLRGGRSWEQAIRAIEERRWFDAERLLTAVVKASPKFVPGWSALGLSLENQEKLEASRDAYQKAIALDPKDLLPYYRLAHLQMNAQQWDLAAKTADTLVRLDNRRRYPSIQLDAAVIRYHLGDLDAAQAGVTAVIRTDTRRQFPRAEYILGLILEARKDFAAAGQHMDLYLRLAPHASDAGAARQRIENLGKSSSTDIASELDVPTAEVSAGEEAWVPGGFKAFATIAHMTETPTYASFFLEYCRRLVRENEPANVEALPDFAGTIQTYISAISELTRLGEQRDDTITVTISLQAEEERKKAEKVLGQLGWRLSSHDGNYTVEPGDLPQDVLRQPIPSALGIDEISMEETLVHGRPFSFQFTSETARLDNAGIWRDWMKTLPVATTGPAELFARDLRLARVYTALGSIEPGAAAVLLKSVGIRAMIAQHAAALAHYAGEFAVSKGVVVLPGGSDAHSVWQRLAGASPFDPPSFFRALLEKDHGTLAAFYHAIARTDRAHQKFFTQSADRAERFYGWYRRSAETAGGAERIAGTWRATFFGDLPLSQTGHVRFPGGAEIWSVSEDNLTQIASLEALAPLAKLEEQRKSPLDPASAGLLLENFADWRHLMPYFESLPALGAPDFQALASFTAVAAKSRPAVRNTLLGEWHSLVYLVVRGARAGTLDDKHAAAAFRRICLDLAAPDYSVRALAILRDLAGGVDLDHAVPTRLLRLEGPHLDAFERVRDLQNTPRIESLSPTPDPGKTLAALTGLVYAATLEPEHLLVAEDPNLLTKHRFVNDLEGRGLPMFPRSELFTSSTEPGSYFSGGFAAIDTLASRLARGGRSVTAGPPPPPASAASPTLPPPPNKPAENAEPAPAEGAVFRASGRLIEIYATIKDEKGRYVDDIAADDFVVTEGGDTLRQVSFETRKSEVSVALLFDNTGSMQPALPALRNAALKLIGDLRPIDSVAVYSFNDTVTELQAFTTDKSAAKRAVMRTRAAGPTALYDALVRVNLDLAGRPGKKVIVVFTDGADNCSVLTTDAAILRAKSAGIPVYTIAQGSALAHPELLRQLATVSKTTGGVAFAIRNPSEIRGVFEAVSEDLMHGYLVTVQPPPADGHTWHPIEVGLRNPKARKVRAREGYYPE